MLGKLWDFSQGLGAWCDPVREGGCDPAREFVDEPCKPVREGCCGPESLNPKLLHMTNDEILSWEAHRDKLVSWCVCVLTHTAPVGSRSLVVVTGRVTMAVGARTKRRRQKGSRAQVRGRHCAGGSGPWHAPPARWGQRLPLHACGFDGRRRCSALPRAATRFAG